MTSENRDFAEAVEILGAILKIAGDPNVKEKLRKLQTAAKKAMKDAAEGQLNREMEAKKGTCPTCRKAYTLKKNGALRRHGTGHCFSHDQMPAEVIPAIQAIARNVWTQREFTGDIAEFGVDSNGRTQGNSGG